MTTSKRVIITLDIAPPASYPDDPAAHEAEWHSWARWRLDHAVSALLKAQCDVVGAEIVSTT